MTNYEQINVGAGINTNLKYILEYIKKKSSSVSNLDFGTIPYRENELMESNNDISKLNKLGWKVNYTIEQGLDMVISYEKNIIVNVI